MKTLTKHQKRFAEYLVSHYCSQTEALRAVSPKARNWKDATAHARASALSAMPQVAAYVDELEQAVTAKTVLSGAEVLQELNHIAFHDLPHLMTRVEYDALSPADLRVIKKVHPVAGDRDRLNLEFRDRVRALECLARAAGLFNRHVATPATRQQRVFICTGSTPDAADDYRAPIVEED